MGRSRGPSRGLSPIPGPTLSSGPTQGSAGPVVTDVQVLSDRNPQPAGYSRAPEFPEPRKCRWEGAAGLAELGPRFWLLLHPRRFGCVP